jgi:hypothetical protein
MRSKTFLLGVILQIMSISACTQEESLLGDITIKAFYYLEPEKLPIKSNQFDISITRMLYQSMDSMQIIEKVFIENVDIYVFSPPALGRYVIAVSQDNAKDVLDIKYLGGDIELSMIMR